MNTTLPTIENPSKFRTGWISWFFILTLHICLTSIMTWPAISHFQDSIFGGAIGDKWVYIWDFWWFKHALVNLGISPFFTHMQFQPTGTSLALHDMNYLWSMLSIPLQSFLTLPTILNIFMLSCFILNGLSFYYFAYQITGCKSGAITGSVLFAYCPYFLGRFSVSHVGLLAAFFIPLFLLTIWRYHQSPSLKLAIKAGVYIALAQLCHFYYGSILIIVFVLFMVYQLFTPSNRISTRKFLCHVAVSALTTAILLSPILIPVLSQEYKGDYSSSTPTNYQNYEFSSPDLLNFFVPDYDIATWRGYQWLANGQAYFNKLNNSLHKCPNEGAVYPGLISWLIFITALCLPSIRKRFWAWMVLALFFFIWTLGPTLFVNGTPYLKGFMPMRLLGNIPIFSQLRTVSRFSFFIPIVAGLLFAAGMAELRRKQLNKSAIILSGLTLVLIVLEFIPFPQDIIPQDIFVSPFYKAIAKDKRNYTILNIPADFIGARGGADIYLYAQTFHEKPIIGGYISRTPDYALTTSKKYPFIQAVENHEYDKDKHLRLSPQGLANTKKVLTDLNIRYVVVHRPLISKYDWPRLIYWLGKGLGKPIYNDRWILVYNGWPAADLSVRPRLHTKGN